MPWPKLLRDVKNLPVRTRRELRNGYMTIPAGSTGTVNAGSSWTRLYFKADACPHCGVKAHCGGLSKHDLEPVLPLVDADSTEAHQTG